MKKTMTKMMNMIRWNRDNGSDHRPLQPGPDEDSPDRPEDMLILLVFFSLFFVLG
jgi:hypothetical protein